MIRRLAFVLFTVGCAASGSCAHGSRVDLSQTVASIDVIDEHGTTTTLAPAVGQVVVLDLCAAWSDACLLNARAMSSACEVLCNEDVAMYTVLLDDVGTTSVRAMRDVMKVKHTVVLAGPTTRAGKTVLGSVTDIPRLVIFDRDGEIHDDVVGAVISAWGIVEKARQLNAR